MLPIKPAPVHPGRILLNLYIEPLNLTISALADALGVSRRTISCIVNEHKSVTPEMALRLSRAFHTTPELWLNLQRNFDLWKVKNRSREWEKVKQINRHGFIYE